MGANTADEKIRAAEQQTIYVLNAMLHEADALVQVGLGMMSDGFKDEQNKARALQRKNISKEGREKLERELSCAAQMLNQGVGKMGAGEEMAKLIVKLIDVRRLDVPVGLVGSTIYFDTLSPSQKRKVTIAWKAEGRI